MRTRPLNLVAEKAPLLRVHSGVWIVGNRHVVVTGLGLKLNSVRVYRDADDLEFVILESDHHGVADKIAIVSTEDTLLGRVFAEVLEATGALAWGALYLRNAQVRTLLPLKRH